MTRPLLLLFAGLLAPLARSAPPAAPLEPTRITCQHAEGLSTDKEMHTVLTGEVVVTGTNIRIRCDRMEITSLREAGKDEIISRQNRFKALIATGRVQITQGGREATCGRAEVYPGEDRVVLSESPTVTDKDTGWTYTGRNLYLLRGEQRIHGDEVVITGPALKDLGYERKPADELKSPDSK